MKKLIILSLIVGALKSQTQVNWVTQINNLPVLDTRKYDFVPYAPGGTISAGVNSITMRPVPLGVNGSNSAHYLYVYGGTGTAEICLISGGAGTSGSVSGTIFLTCANSHSGAFKIKSATGGIREALTFATTSYTPILVPTGTITLYASVHIPSNVTLMGMGREASVIKLGDSTITATTPWLIPASAGFYCVICFDQSTSNQVLKDFTLDGNGANNTWFYYTDITGLNASNVTIRNVTAKNHPISGGTGVMMGFFGHAPKSSNTNNLIDNANVIGIANCTVPNGGGAYYIEGLGNRVVNSHAVNFCDSPFVLADCDHCTVENSVADVGTGQMATATFSIEGATYSSFVNDECVKSGSNGHRFCASVGSQTSPNLQSFGNSIINLKASGSSTAVTVGTLAYTGTQVSTDTRIIGLNADSCVLDCLVLNEMVNKVTIIGGQIESSGGSGIAISSNGSTTNLVQNVLIDGIQIDHAHDYGILASNVGVGPAVDKIKIVNSFIGDSYAVPRQIRGIWFQNGTVSDAFIVGNTLTGNVTSPTFFQNSWGSGATIGPNVTGGGDSNLIYTSNGSNVASASTITPTGTVFHVTGTTTIQTINVAGPASVSSGINNCIRIIPDGLFATNTAGNIAIASTAVVSKVLMMCYDNTTSKWYPSY